MPVALVALTLTVYVVPAVSALDGVNVSTVPEPLEVVPVTVFPLESVSVSVVDPLVDRLVERDLHRRGDGTLVRRLREGRRHRWRAPPIGWYTTSTQ